MARFPVVLRGYDCAQVDALTARIEDALQRGAGFLTAEDVLRSRFAVVLRGYDQQAVDEYLYECIRRLREGARPVRPQRRPRVPAGRLIDWIHGIEFSGAGMRTGYDARDVDAFLDRVVAGLRGAGPPVTAGDVRASSFRTVRFGPGYDEREVDRFLTELADALESAVTR
ncbi:DivIVA domain-containing protein [Thermomonospora echinospora]|uniref:Cell wall synthesis protein Wag31 n=1 Tax=Thermomonospora echinospora TaxID=1992 RepID=A0A1H6DQU1_9ACTN|nr:DivIVA domain-containing protein [Thermomonospora echinospora]SEG86955.1 DivIVA domain-containing protein [Thermomonospora echinospora]